MCQQYKLYKIRENHRNEVNNPNEVKLIWNIVSGVHHKIDMELVADAYVDNLNQLVFF